jgi:hypothetical protein
MNSTGAPKGLRITLRIFSASSTGRSWVERKRTGLGGGVGVGGEGVGEGIAGGGGAVGVGVGGAAGWQARDRTRATVSRAQSLRVHMIHLLIVQCGNRWLSGNI